MDWPAYSPDLNPIEHVWDALGRRIAARLHHPENTQQLKQMLIEEWALLPQEMLHQLVLSMRRRCEATIACNLSSNVTVPGEKIHLAPNRDSIHIEQRNDLELFALPPFERVKTEGDLCRGLCNYRKDVHRSRVGPAPYHCAFKQMWLATLTAVSLGLGSNPGEDMDICECIVPSRHGGALNSHQAASPLVRLVEGEER
ncbi:transposable element Tcb2 transposase [Trichonephila clavipes]|nr:transposable element Tcb2 transposase [Trichonephila clavipes]